MKRLITLVALATIVLYTTAQQTQYSRVKITANDQQIIEIAKSGIDITEGILEKGEFLIMELSDRELVKIAALELDYDVLIEDVSKFYVDRNVGKSTDMNDYKGVSEWEVPENFTFGSMSGHATFDELVVHLDNMYDLFPDLITQKESLGQTAEGRDLWMVKISDNPTINETEPEVLYTSLHHAREPAGLMTNLFYMYFLLENYETDPWIKTLVDNTEMYFIPVVNPDGYVYNQSTNPSGGGMWRKNRIDNGIPGCEGVDPNRNYGYMWGLDNIGSSPDPCSATYRGESAFSELENQAVRDFCNAHEIANALNYHTYSNLLLYTWGYTEEPCPDDAIYYAHSTLYTVDNNYTYGAGSITIYPTNGGSDDWMYGEQNTKPKIFAYTPELGGGGDGFWCSIDRIVPIAQENMIMNTLTAAFAGWYADLQVETFPLISETEGYITYDLVRLGLKDGATFTVNIEPLSELIISGPLQKTYAGMEILEAITDSVPYMLNVGTPSGTQLQFLVSIDNGQYVLKDTITRIFGEAEVVFEDNCNDMTNWISPTWNVTTSSYVSPTGSITDSPAGNYPNNHTSGVLLDEEVDLSEAGFAMLNFWAKWEIETGYDYVQFMVSGNGGSSWDAVEGKYTVTGNGNQAPGEPVYDGFQTEWVQEEIDLSAYSGGTVTFRFILKSDYGVTEDGFYFDDFRISVVEVSPVGLPQIKKQDKIVISDPSPNPAKGEVHFRYASEQSGLHAKFNVYNASGQLVLSHSLHEPSGNLTINLNDWESGIYHYRIESAKHQSNSGKLIVY